MCRSPMTDLDEAHDLHCACVGRREYQLRAHPNGDGEARWLLLERDREGWRHVATWETAVPPNGNYEEGGLSRMREHGFDPNLADVHLDLPDGERLRPARLEPPG